MWTSWTVLHLTWAEVIERAIFDKTLLTLWRHCTKDDGIRNVAEVAAIVEKGQGSITASQR